MQELTDAVGALGRRFLLRIGNIRATIEIIDVQQQNLQTAFGLTELDRAELVLAATAQHYLLGRHLLQKHIAHGPLVGLEPNVPDRRHESHDGILLDRNDRAKPRRLHLRRVPTIDHFDIVRSRKIVVQPLVDFVGNVFFAAQARNPHGSIQLLLLAGDGHQTDGHQQQCYSHIFHKTICFH